MMMRRELACWVNPDSCFHARGFVILWLGFEGYMFLYFIGGKQRVLLQFLFFVHTKQGSALCTSLRLVN